MGEFKNPIQMNTRSSCTAFQASPYACVTKASGWMTFDIEPCAREPCAFAGRTGERAKSAPLAASVALLLTCALASRRHPPAPPGQSLGGVHSRCVFLGGRR